MGRPAKFRCPVLLNEINNILIKIKTQEEEITHYVKDFPINKKHQYYQEHNNIKSSLIKVQQQYKSFYKNIQINLGSLLFI
ncbi:MAG: hypothetical protein U9R19_15020 [Bacteroidota bacterium]|nr:hypothetical protein [Bacteroidota bacterium]